MKERQADRQIEGYEGGKGKVKVKNPIDFQERKEERKKERKKGRREEGGKEEGREVS